MKGIKKVEQYPLGMGMHMSLAQWRAIWQVPKYMCFDHGVHS